MRYERLNLHFSTMSEATRVINEDYSDWRVIGFALGEYNWIVLLEREIK